MIIKGLEECDVVNYRKTSMFISFPSCTFKCEKECGEHCCQNSALAQTPNIDVGVKTIVNKYVNNPLTSAVVIGGLEPFDSELDLLLLIAYLRVATQDDIVIYTGFTKEELQDGETYKSLLRFKNIIIKFGRYIPHQQPHYDPVLGVMLASDNQYAERIS